MADYTDRIEVWTTHLLYTDPVVTISGRRIQAGGKVYAIVADKHGRISKGVDMSYVESFSTRSQPAQAVERAFQEALEGGDILAEIMDYEMSKRATMPAPTEDY